MTTYVDWFWERVDTSGGPDACWPWMAARNAAGYGKVQVMSPGDPSVPLAMKAHRLSYLLHYGPPPADLYVIHSCDNPPCVNPRHLRLGTALDNARDRVTRGRNINGNAAKTSCMRGHPFDEANTYIVPRTGHRQCMTCRDIWNKSRAKGKAA